MNTKRLGEVVFSSDRKQTIGQVISVVAEKPLFTIKYRSGNDRGTIELNGDKVTLTTDRKRDSGTGTLVLGKEEMYYRGSAGNTDIDLKVRVD